MPLPHKCAEGDMRQVERVATQVEPRQYLTVVCLVVRGHGGEVRGEARRIPLEDGRQREAANVARIAEVHPEVRVGQAQPCQGLRQR